MDSNRGVLTLRETEKFDPSWISQSYVVQGSNEDVQCVAGILDQRILNILSNQGIEHLFSIQAKVIPLLCGRLIHSKSPYCRDLCVSAPTGNGKTLCYVLPIVQSLIDRLESQISAIVLVPTRELSNQICKVFELFSDTVYYHPLRCVSINGHHTITEERYYLQGKNIYQRLNKGLKSRNNDTDQLQGNENYPCITGRMADVIVCTPGRLVDHFENICNLDLDKSYFSHNMSAGVMPLSHLSMELFYKKHRPIRWDCLKWIVLDEVDRLLGENCHFWVDVINRICNLQPTRIEGKRRIRKLLFSATMTDNPSQLHSLLLHKPLLVSDSERAPQELFQTVLICSSKQNKKKTLLHFISNLYCVIQTKKKKLSETIGTHSFLEIRNNLKTRGSDILGRRSKLKIIVFCASKQTTHFLTRLLQFFSAHPDNTNVSLRIAEFSAALSRSARQKLFEDFNNGRLDVVICSDVMARGLDIFNVDIVINFDAPKHSSTYLHRCGRTARAGRRGWTYTFLVSKKDIQNTSEEKSDKMSRDIISLPSDSPKGFDELVHFNKLVHQLFGESQQKNLRVENANQFNKIALFGDFNNETYKICSTMTEICLRLESNGKINLHKPLSKKFVNTLLSRLCRNSDDVSMEVKPAEG